MNQEGWLVVCVQVTRRDQKNLLLTLEFNRLLPYCERHVATLLSLADFVLIISSLYSGVHRPKLYFVYFSRFILEASSCLNIASAKLFLFSGLWLSD